MLMKEVPYFQSLQSRRFEARLRPGRGPASDAKHIGTKDKARLTGTGKDFYCCRPSKAPLEVVGNCAASLEF